MPHSNDDRPTATRKQAALFLGKTVNTLWRWEHRPDKMGLDCYTRPNGEKFYYWDDLLRWKHAHPREPEEEVSQSP